MTIVASTQAIRARLGDMIPTHISTPKTGYISNAAFAVVSHIVVSN